MLSKLTKKLTVLVFIFLTSCRLATLDYNSLRLEKNNLGFDMVTQYCATNNSGQYLVDKCFSSWGSSRQLNEYDVTWTAVTRCYEMYGRPCLQIYRNDQYVANYSGLQKYLLQSDILKNSYPDTSFIAGAIGDKNGIREICGIGSTHQNPDDKEAKEAAINACTGLGYGNVSIEYMNGKRISDNYAENSKKNNFPNKKYDEDFLNKLFIVGIGTGFFINSSGNFVTNSHVIDGECIDYKIKQNSEFKDIQILANDPVNDIAVGKINLNSQNSFLNLANQIKLGEEIILAGYPLALTLKSDSIKVNKGIVSSMSGINNNFSEIQIDAPVQPGNSGGPIVNMSGNVVGVTTSQLTNAQNVNFGKKTDILSLFLKSNNVKFSQTGSVNVKKTEEIASKLDISTFQIFCSNTGEKWMELLEKEKVPQEVSELIN